MSMTKVLNYKLNDDGTGEITIHGSIGSWAENITTYTLKKSTPAQVKNLAKKSFRRPIRLEGESCRSVSVEEAMQDKNNIYITFNASYEYYFIEGNCYRRTDWYTDKCPLGSHRPMR